MMSHCDNILVILFCVLELFENPFHTIVAETGTALTLRLIICIVIKGEKSVTGSKLNNITHRLLMSRYGLARSEIVVHFPQIMSVADGRNLYPFISTAGIGNTVILIIVSGSNNIDSLSTVFKFTQHLNKFDMRIHLTVVGNVAREKNDIGALILAQHIKSPLDDIRTVLNHHLRF